MGENSKIEWCDSTFNPVIGCQKVSRGCDNCYAEHFLDHRFHRVQWGPHGVRVRTSEQTWKQPLRWNAQALKNGIRRRVFCASLSDWLDNRWKREWRTEFEKLVEATPALTWMLLSKRPENFRKLSSWSVCPDNVWFGVTGEDQKNFDHRWRIAAQVKARIHFISYEPALGPLRLPHEGPLPDWIICGGESGPGARTMRMIWAQRLRDQCRERGIAFFLKQFGSNSTIAGVTGKGDDPAEWPENLRIREFPTEVYQWSAVRNATDDRLTSIGRCA